jgi:dipeptidyl aminopeptidase/acylaminoacyl peptidase
MPAGAHALYYPPHNTDFTGPSDQKPPLVVMFHGGPTAMASSTLKFGIHYWTSRGVAVLDVNYRGSSGFGRRYRNLLKENWGKIDVHDCINGAKWLAQRKLVDASRTVITGGSAGGFTTLASLTFHKYFKAGASHYAGLAT